MFVFTTANTKLLGDRSKSYISLWSLKPHLRKTVSFLSNQLSLASQNPLRKIRWYSTPKLNMLLKYIHTGADTELGQELAT